jgi:hypothetical protein
LIKCIVDVLKNIEDGKQTDILIMDFSTASDKVSHSLLLHKLQNYGIDGKVNSWIERYFTTGNKVFDN